MDRTAIKTESQSFIAACESKGHKLSFCALIPEMPNYEDTSYILQTSSSWFEGRPCSEIFEILVPILFESTTVDFRKKIYRIDIYDKKGKLNCMFDDLILVNDIGYDPRLVNAFQSENT